MKSLWNNFPRDYASQVISGGKSLSAIALLAGQWILLVSSALVILLTVRMLVDGRRWLETGIEQLRDRADTDQIVNSLENAARSYVPGSPYPERALWHLAVVARSASMRGNAEQALHTWEVLRRSVLSSRHVFQPHRDYLEMSQMQIVRLRSSALDHGEPVAAPDQTIQLPPDPSPWLSLILFIGLTLWGIGAIGLCLLPRQKKTSARTVLFAASVAGFLLWVSMSGLA